MFIKFLEVLRYHSFWLKDLLLGSIIKNHISEIRIITNHYPSKTSKRLRVLYMQNLLKHAAQTTAFYKDFKNKKFEDYPIINKNTVRDNLDRFCSSSYINSTNKIVKTSGSTGAILKITHDKNKVARNTADTIHFASKANFKVGYRLYYMRHWLEYYKKNTLVSSFQNIKPIEALNLDKATVFKLISSIKNDTSNMVWQGYASAFEHICRQLDKENFKPVKIPNLKSIITMSEGLNNYTKERLEHYFSTPVVSRYSNMENGIIAQQNINADNTFEINWASYHVEILKLDEDVPALSNTLGRIVVTDLFNYATPLIRYDTGDIGAIDYTASPPVFTKIEGRKTDIILNTKGEMVSSFIMMNSYSFNGVKQSQLIQETKKEYTLKLNVSRKFNQEKDIKKLYTDLLGEDAKVSVEYVDEIPLLSSGKRKATINNFLKP